MKTNRRQWLAGGALSLLLGSAAHAQQWATNGTNINNTNTGNVGIGTTTPGQKLTMGTGNIFLVNTNGAVDGNIFFGGVTALGQNGMRLFGGFVNGILHAGFIDVVTPDLTDGLRFRVDNTNGGLERMRITANGLVGIGTLTPTQRLHVAGGNLQVDGDVIVSGNIAAKYQDLAEWVQGRGALGAGTVVILDDEHSNQVLPSHEAYDTRVAGVVSATPGIVLGEPGDGKVKVATTGRVKVKVDASERPVRVGDLLVTSSKPGVAMKSDPVSVAGIPMHRPGTIVGKALEPLAQGEGEILVLLSMQ